MRYALLFLFLAFCMVRVDAQEIMSVEQAKAILEEADGSGEVISSPRGVLFCWSKADHPPQTHSYKQFARSWEKRLNQIDKISAKSHEGFPTDEQWADADLVVFNLTQKTLTPKQLAKIDTYLNRGGAMIVIHQGLVLRKGFDGWADRIGFAFSWESGEAKSKWGRGDLEIGLDIKHEIFHGFPEKVRFADELYWNLKPGVVGDVSVLGTTPAPAKNGETKKDAKEWPVFWTVEHPATATKRSGRVFCSVVGHFDHVSEDAFYQAVLIRAIAWCLEEPCQPLVGILD